MVQATQDYIYGKTKLSDEELEKARKIILDLQAENAKLIEQGYGPFLAAAYDDKGNLVAKMANTVAKENCCLWHAEVNTIKKACENLKTYDLAPYNLSLYVTAEPCIMCCGAIMWSGIQRVFYSVNSADVERITGFDEGFLCTVLRIFAAAHHLPAHTPDHGFTGRGQGFKGFCVAGFCLPDKNRIVHACSPPHVFLCTHDIS